MMFFIYVADGIMSYVSPVLIETRMHNTFLMGIILSSSSVVGLCADMGISKFFVQKEYRFFLRWLIGLAVFFPLSFLLFPPEPMVFLLAMAIWGIYYEFIAFSQYNFINRAVTRQQHAGAWGFLDAFKAAGLLVAPLIASTLLDKNEDFPLIAVIVALLIAAVFYVVFFGDRTKERSVPVVSARTQQKRSLISEFKIWAVFMRKIWPVYLFFFTFMVMETSFWVLGPLLMEEIKDIHVFGAFVLSAYILPSFLMPLYVQKLGAVFGKKRTAFVTAIVGASLLAFSAFFFSHSWFFPFLVGLSSLFLSLDYPEIEAVFEDYIDRAQDYGNDLIGLHGTASSLGYIVGPSIAGGLALVLGTGKSMAVFAAVLAVVSLVLLLITPRKIKLPQQELSQVVK